MNKLDYCLLLQRAEPMRFTVTQSPWGTTLLIDKYGEYYKE